MKMINVVKKAVIVGYLMVLAGCASSGSGYVTTKQFEGMSSEEQQKVMTELKSSPAALEEFWLATLQAFRPVEFEYGNTDYTLKCQWLPNKDYNHLVLYEGRDPASLSRNSDQAMLVLAADGSCQAQLGKNEGGQTKAIVIVQHSGMPEGLMSAVIKRTVPAFTNGMGSVALRDALGTCGKGCGGGGNVFNVMAAARSASDLNSTQTTTVGTDVCATGECEEVPDT